MKDALESGFGKQPGLQSPVQLNPIQVYLNPMPTIFQSLWEKTKEENEKTEEEKEVCLTNSSFSPR